MGCLLTLKPSHALRCRLMTHYAELHCLSNFTFLRGASHPEELVARAHELGYAALALTDECSLAGVVRAHVAAKAHGLKLIVGSEIRCSDGPRVVLLATDREGYGNLSALITLGRRSATKGHYRLAFKDICDGLPGCLALLLPDPLPCLEQARQLAAGFAGRSWLAVELFRAPDDAERLAALSELGAAARLALVAAGEVHMHVAERRPLQDTLAAIRLSAPTWRASIPVNCWNSLWQLRRAAVSHSTNCATNIPRNWCRQGRRPSPTCGG
jgi:DNA polymerase III alpha subunit